METMERDLSGQLSGIGGVLEQDFFFRGISVSEIQEGSPAQEEKSTLIAQIGEKVILYPQRMSQTQQELFQLELGEEMWQEVLERVSGNERVLIDM